MWKADLSEVKLEAHDVTECELVNDVRPQQWDVEAVVIWVTLKRLQDDVQHSVRVKVKAAWNENNDIFIESKTKDGKKIQTICILFKT